MSCTAEQIAEKRRIALERLKAKQKLQNPNGNASITVRDDHITQLHKPVNPINESNNINSKRDIIAEKKKIALERLKATCQKTQNTSQVPGTENQYDFYNKPVNSFYGKTNNAVSNSGTSNRLQTTDSTHKIKYPKNRILSQPYPHEKPADASKKTQDLAPIFVKSVTCTCMMIADDRFTVVPSGFHPKLIDIFKTIPSKNFDMNTKIWSFHRKDHNLIQDRVSMLNPDVVIGSIPIYVLKLLEAPINKIDFSCLHSIEPTLSESLMHFQKEGVCFGIEKQGRCMIADEMGLGKTYQALAIADFYKEDWPLLVCTTAATRDIWASKVRTLLPYIPCQNIVCMTTVQEYFGDAKVLIASYSIMEKNVDKLLEKNFGFLILDESHLLKNFKAKSTSVAIQLARKARRVVLLTGTPALSRPSELFSQLQMIDRTFCSYKEYTTRYCAAKQSNFGWDASGQSNLPELNVVLNKKFMIRRTKQEVLCQLAEKSRETVILDSALIWNDSETTENMKSYANDFMKFKGRDREEILLKYYSETAIAKSKAVCAYVKGLIKANKKFIIFAHHHVMLNAISDCLKKLNVDYIRIDGTTKNDLRTTRVNHFQNNTNCRVAVLSLKACNAGITLTATQLVIFAELDWNPSTLAQAESRAHRIGQEGTVTCRYLLAKGTADDTIWEMLKSKQNVLNKAGLCNDDLSDATHTIGPTSSENIKQYLVKTTNENRCDNNLNTTKNNEPKAGVSNEYAELFDGNDDDFTSLDY